jgi:hypothetical protein
MTGKRALEQWETKIANCDVTPQAIWPVAKFLTNRGRPKAPSVIHRRLSPIFYPINKASIIADCLENQYTPHELCEARIHALLATLMTPLLNTNPLTTQKKHNL